MKSYVATAVMLLLAFVSWVGVAFYIYFDRQPDPLPVITIQEPDTGPFRSIEYEPGAAPHMLLTPCPLTIQNVPIVEPERKA